MDVLATQLTSTECCTVDPVPERPTLTEGLEALLLICSAPETLPEFCGANVTVTLLLCPEASVKGSVGPVWLKPVPVVPMLLTVMDVLELLLSVTVCLALVPISTLPNASDCGLTVSVP